MKHLEPLPSGWQPQMAMAVTDHCPPHCCVGNLARVQQWTSHWPVVEKLPVNTGVGQGRAGQNKWHSYSVLRCRLLGSWLSTHSTCPVCWWTIRILQSPSLPPSGRRDGSGFSSSLWLHSSSQLCNSSVVTSATERAIFNVYLKRRCWEKPQDPDIVNSWYKCCLSVVMAAIGTLQIKYSLVTHFTHLGWKGWAWFPMQQFGAWADGGALPECLDWKIQRFHRISALQSSACLYKYKLQCVCESLSIEFIAYYNDSSLRVAGVMD